jgi:chemotaxis signal transduction protein
LWHNVERASKAACLVLVVLTASSMSQPEVCADIFRPPVSEILIFTVDNHRYGLSTACVQELVRAVHSVPLPHFVDGIEGVIDLHGQIVPVIDLRRILGLAGKAPQPTEHMIIVDNRPHQEVSVKIGALNGEVETSSCHSRSCVASNQFLPSIEPP